MSSQSAAEGAGTAVMLIVVAAMLIAFGVMSGTMTTNNRWEDYRMCLEDHDIEVCDELLNPPGLHHLEE